MHESGLSCIRCEKGKYNPLPGGECAPCPNDQTSTKPFHTCHCKPGMFNATRVNIRCFEPMEQYQLAFTNTQLSFRLSWLVTDSTFAAL